MSGYTEFEDTQPDAEDVIDRLRARVAELEAAARLARPYIVQATEGMDPPAPALTVLDAALAQGSGK